MENKPTLIIDGKEFALADSDTMRSYGEYLIKLADWLYSAPSPPQSVSSAFQAASNGNNNIPADKREVIIEALASGLSHRDVAEVAGVAKGTVTRLARIAGKVADKSLIVGNPCGCGKSYTKGPGGIVWCKSCYYKTGTSDKNPAAVALGRLGGLVGGNARADSLSADERSEIAKNAANARWNPRVELPGDIAASLSLLDKRRKASLRQWSE